MSGSTKNGSLQSIPSSLRDGGFSEPADVLRNPTSEKILGRSGPASLIPASFSSHTPSNGEYKLISNGLPKTGSVDDDNEVGQILSTVHSPLPPRDFSPRAFSRTPGPKKAPVFSPPHFNLFKEPVPPLASVTTQVTAPIEDELTDDENNSELNMDLIRMLLATPIDKDRHDARMEDDFLRLTSNNSQESRRVSQVPPPGPQRVTQHFPPLAIDSNHLGRMNDYQSGITHAHSDSEVTKPRQAGRSSFRYNQEAEAESLPVQYLSDSNSSSSGSYKSASSVQQEYGRDREFRFRNHGSSGIRSQLDQISTQPLASYTYSDPLEQASIPPIKKSGDIAPQPRSSRYKSNNASQSRNSGSVPHGIASKPEGSYDTSSSYSSYDVRRSNDKGGYEGASSLRISRNNGYVTSSYQDMSGNNVSFHSTAHGPNNAATNSSIPPHKPPSDPLDSPTTKQKYKEFSATLKTKFKLSDQEAKEFALRAIPELPTKAQWRGFVDLAELSKKMDDADIAREYYLQACKLAPRSSTAWLEWSKMEEENGRIIAALRVLIMGLLVCDAQESLLPRVVKIYERLHYSSHVREVLSQLKYDSIDRTWKLLLEGCLFEAREGCSDKSRQIFRYLMKHVHWHGPIYHEAFRLEEREGREEAAVQIARTGLRELKHYGPLWFGLMSVLERRDIKNERNSWMRGIEPELKLLTEESIEAAKSISKELTWRVYYEKFMAEERAAEIAARGTYLTSQNFLLSTCRVLMLERCRLSLIQSLLKSVVPPNNLRWKILLVAARLELSMGNEDTARRLQQRAWVESPAKSKLYPILESSRLEEYVGRVDIARKLLYYGRKEMGYDWKGYLEAVLVEIRAGCIIKALERVKEAVKVHPGTGRLWALYIQLIHRIEHLSKMQMHIGQDSSFATSPCVSVIRQAIQEVPKSGEVWCEAARSVMNPFSLQSFDLGMGMVWCGYGIHFTPQYGDSFIEFMRANILGGVYLKWVCGMVGIGYERFVRRYLAGDKESDVYSGSVLESYPETGGSNGTKKALEGIIMKIYNMECEIPQLTVDKVPYKHLKQRCINADPNYGLGWVYCSNPPFHLPPLVLSNCLEKLVGEMESAGTASLYCRALLHYVYRMLRKDQAVNGLGEDETTFILAYQRCIPQMPLLTNSSSLHLPYPPVVVRGQGGRVMYTREDFVMGLVGLSRAMYTPTRNQEERRKMIFGGDQIVS